MSVDRFPTEMFASPDGRILEVIVGYADTSRFLKSLDRAEKLAGAARTAQAAGWPGLEGMDLAKDVTCAQSYGWDEGEWAWPGGFARQTLDFGPAAEASGLGIYFWVQDLTGNGYPDIVAPGKEGLYLFENMGEGEA